jgi:hypothetical protein
MRGSLKMERYESASRANGAEGNGVGSRDKRRQEHASASGTIVRYHLGKTKHTIRSPRCNHIVPEPRFPESHGSPVTRSTSCRSRQLFFPPLLRLVSRVSRVSRVRRSSSVSRANRVGRLSRVCRGGRGTVVELVGLVG